MKTVLSFKIWLLSHMSHKTTLTDKTRQHCSLPIQKEIQTAHQENCLSPLHPGNVQTHHSRKEPKPWKSTIFYIYFWNNENNRGEQDICSSGLLQPLAGWRLSSVRWDVTELLKAQNDLSPGLWLHGLVSASKVVYKRHWVAHLLSIWMSFGSSEEYLQYHMFRNMFCRQRE